VGAVGLSLLNTARLRRAQRRLRRELALAEAAAQAKTQFLTTVSHEMRTPLNALLGVAELLDESPLTREQRRQVGLFRDAGHGLLTLINDLLDLSKIDAGKLILQPGRVELHTSMQDLVALLRPRAAAKGLQLTLQWDERLPAHVWIDRQRLMQAVTNLVGNAIKFTASGQVVLQVRSSDAPPPGQAAGRSTRETREGRAPARWMRLSVSDTGIGIAADRVAEVFEPFAQADASIARDYGGTGLGLSLTRQIARAMGGDIDVTSEPGRGSTFTLHLPCIEPPPALDDVVGSTPATLEPEVQSPQGSGAPAGTLETSDWDANAPCRVLLAEDNEVNTYLFCAMLAGPDRVIETAPDGLAAWDLLQTRRYHIAFIDIQMPGMDGLTLARQLRAFETARQRPRLPLVALTANAFASDVEASLQAGCDHHLPKPFTREMLREAIDRYARPGEAPSN
jgi:signal transduction histidine kinase/ActR/RegA family two-component response regulator